MHMWKPQSRHPWRAALASIPSATSLRLRIHSALRYKLLALVLLPLFLALLAALAGTLYWLNSFTQESLFRIAREDLTLARHGLRQLQDQYQAELQKLADTSQFRALLAQNDPAALRRALARARDAKGFAFLHVTGPAGNWLDVPRAGVEASSKPSPLTDRAVRGLPGSALEVFRAEDLRREGGELAAIARTDGKGDVRSAGQALLLRLVLPVVDPDGRVVAVLDGGIALNQKDGTALEAIRARVFGASQLPEDAEPIVSLALNDARIATTRVELSATDGQRVPAEARARVLNSNEEVWVGRERLGEHGFVSAYGPLFDVNNQRVGMLHVGVREDAFRASHTRAALLLLAIFLAASGIAAWIALRGLGTALRPLETMAAVVRATRAGEDRRIGPIGSRDEIGELAQQFDAMLDELARRNHEIQRAAQALEAKVAERTRDLASKNRELETTVALLQKTREQLVFAEKLSALGQMAAGIAHEINNPAAVILGNLEMLETELGEHGKPVTRELELIKQQVERVRHIVTSLLQFARARPAEGTVSDVDVNSAIEDVLPLVGHVLSKKSVQLRKRLSATATVAINVYDLEQVLINLIVNAANAVAERGTIEIESRDWEREGVMIAVHDDGAGIRSEHLLRIFDPFFTTDPHQGVGLGLSVSYGLVHRYGGDITVESTAGKGSVFRVWLRRRPEGIEAAA
jgi:two-component system NtrC family sensor kinase